MSRVMVSSVVLAALAATASADSPSDAGQPVQYKRTRVGHRTAAKLVLLGLPVGFGISIGIGLHERAVYHDAVARDDIEAANHAASINRWVATSFFLAGVACIPVGAVLWIKSSTVVLTPITPASGTGGGAALALRF